jgi:hypothetical protein
MANWLSGIGQAASGLMREAGSQSLIGREREKEEQERQDKMTVAGFEDKGEGFVPGPHHPSNVTRSEGEAGRGHDWRMQERRLSQEAFYTAANREDQYAFKGLDHAMDRFKTELDNKKFDKTTEFRYADLNMRERFGEYDALLREHAAKQGFDLEALKIAQEAGTGKYYLKYAQGQLYLFDTKTGEDATTPEMKGFGAANTAYQKASAALRMWEAAVSAKDAGVWEGDSESIEDLEKAAIAANKAYRDLQPTAPPPTAPPPTATGSESEVDATLIENWEDTGGALEADPSRPNITSPSKISPAIQPSGGMFGTSGRTGGMFGTSETLRGNYDAMMQRLQEIQQKNPIPSLGPASSGLPQGGSPLQMGGFPEVPAHIPLPSFQQQPYEAEKKN